MIAEPPASASAPAAASVQPRVHARVQPVAPGDPSGLFVDISTTPPPRRLPGPISFYAPVLLRPAFDPDLYRAGKVGEPLSREEICDVVEDVAAEFDIPTPLFTRLIYQESGFRNETVSRAGALGIAQFMPETAEDRGLEDPFDPLQALPASADFLRELIEQFGNFGLAAAAYNAGPTRVRQWLAGRVRLPRETRDYVLRITGRNAEYWAKQAEGNPHPKAYEVRDCDVKPIRASIASSTRRR